MEIREVPKVENKPIEVILETVAKNEKKYLQERRFKLDRKVNPKSFENITSFLEWFLNDEKGNKTSRCVWVDQEIDKENPTAHIQCQVYKNRSTHDLFLLTNYYFSEATLEQVICALINLNESFKISTLWCPNIEARVWYRNTRIDNQTEGIVVSDYDNLYPRRFNNETDNLNYNDLKNLYEYCNKEEEIIA